MDGKDSGPYTTSAMKAREALLNEFMPEDPATQLKIKIINQQIKDKKISFKDGFDKIADLNDEQLEAFQTTIQEVAIETGPKRKQMLQNSVTPAGKKLFKQV